MSEFEKNLEKGGILFWLFSILCAFGLYALIWLFFAIAVMIY